MHQLLIAALFSALSLIPVWVAFHWAGRLYGTAGGALAAVMMATWFESVYFAPKPTPDTVSGYLLLAALFLARPGAERRDLFLAGFSFMLALAMRMQIAPAIGVALVLVATDKHRRTQMVPVVAGAAVGLALAGAIEWLWWGRARQSTARAADGSHRMKKVGRTAVRTLCKSRLRTASGPEGSSAK